MPLAFLINENFFNWTLIGQLFVNGMKNGAIYALMALTVVIIYKTTGHLNFAQGEMGTLGAFIVFVLVLEHGRSYWIAIAVALVFSFVLGAVLERTLIRPIERRSALGVVIVTLGIFLIINALNAAIWGTQQLSPLAPFPNLPDDQFVIAEGPPRFAVRYGAIGTWVTLAIVVAVLWFFFQKTKLGLGYRAVASNRESSQLVGVPVGRMLMLGWAISAVLGTIAAIMVSQSASTLDFNLMASGLAVRLRGSGARRVRQHPGGRCRWAHRRHGRGVHPVVLQLRRVGAEPCCRTRGHRRRLARQT